MRILVASKNPVKIECVRNAFSNYFEDFEVKGISVHSGVPDQPFDEETYLGAKNRAENLFKSEYDADFYVGIEGGIDKKQNKYFAYGAIYICDNKGNSSHAYSSFFQLPPPLVEKMMQEKLELGDIADLLANDSNVKQKQGIIGVLTKNVISRSELYYPAVVSALIPFLNKELYFRDE